jgi:hypothetical protein
MSTEGRRLETTFAAGEDLDTEGHMYHAIALDDGKLANSGEEASGILLSKPKTGEGATLGFVGELKFAAGLAVAKGAKLTVTTSGWMITADSNDPVLGEAKAAVTSGSVGTGLFAFPPATDKADYQVHQITPADTTIAGVAIALDDNKLANTGGEAGGVAVTVLTSGTAGNIAVGGKINIRMDPAVCSSAGDPLVATTSGYFTLAVSGTFVNARALANIGSNALGAALFSGVPVYAFSSSFAW